MPLTSVDVIRAAIYVRISADHRNDEAGVARQEDDGRKLAGIRGWSVAEVYRDNDISALSGALRPGYEALLQDVAAGRIDAIVVWQTSRLWRNRRERADGIDLLKRVGVPVIAVRGPDLDMTTAYGRGMAGLLGEFDTMESEVKSERVVSALEQNAAAGRPHGRRAYGWDRVYDSATGRSSDVINDAEAEVVREIANRILRGDSLRSIVTDLNDRGIGSPTGKPWGKQMLRAVIARHRNVGLRVHRGEVIGRGAWEPILDETTWERVLGVLADPSRKTSTGSAAMHLLSGIAECGVCGGPIRAAVNRGVLSYRCTDHAHVTRKREYVDALVEAVVLARLARPDALEALAPRSGRHLEAATEARDLEARLDAAADEYADGKITARQLERITARLQPRIEDARARARTVDDTHLVHGLLGTEDLASAWEALPVSRKRAIVSALLQVRILKARQGARSFDPATVEIRPRPVN